MSIFDLYQAEINAIHELLLKAKQELQLIDPSKSGFNIGVNNGKDLEGKPYTIVMCI